jgi:hypothetical protein
MSSRFSTCAPPRVERRRPVRDSLQQKREPRLAEQVAAVVAGRAVDRDGDRHAGIAHRPDRRDARGQAHVRAGAMRHAGAGAREERDAGGVELHAVRMPDVAADPAELLGVLRRRAAELLAGVVDVALVFGQVGVQTDTVLARQQRRVAHQLAADREGRAGRDDDTLHRVARRIVPALDDTLRVGEDRRFVLHHAVRRQAAHRFADAHRAARGVEAHADPGCRLQRVVQPHAIREQVEVVARGRAAGEQQFDHRRLRRDEGHLGRQPRPDRVERLQPVEQGGVLRRAHDAGERLVEVVMGVDEAGHEHLAARIDHLVGRSRQVGAGADRLDHAVAHEHAAARDLAPFLVHRDEQGRVADQQRCHFNALPPPWLPRSRRPCLPSRR